MNIDLFRKRTGLKYKEAAKVLGVNPVTLTRWKQKHKGEIPADYKDKMNKALKGKKGTHVPKAPLKRKKKIQVVELTPEPTKEEWGTVVVDELYMKILDLYADLPKEEKFSAIRTAIKKFLTTKE